AEETQGESSNSPSPPLFRRRPPKRGTPPIANESSPSLSDSRSIIFSPCRANPLLTPSCFVHCSDGNATSSTGALERAPSAAAADIVAVPSAVDRAKPSRHANAFSLKSSSKPLNNPRQWRSKCGDRPPSSSPPVAVAIVVSASSGSSSSRSSRRRSPAEGRRRREDARAVAVTKTPEKFNLTRDDCLIGEEVI
ncbi:Os01g0387333, partial [Oryza sativa Japonica Group]